MVQLVNKQRFQVLTWRDSLELPNLRFLRSFNISKATAIPLTGLHIRTRGASWKLLTIKHTNIWLAFATSDNPTNLLETLL